MHLVKKSTAALLLLLMLLTTVSLPVGARDIPNVTFTIDKLTASEGEEITVTISHKDMSVISFAGGIRFNTDMLTCTSIVGTKSGKVYLYPEDDEDFKATAVSSPEDAAAAGTVGFAFAGTEEVFYPAAEILTATFTVNKGARGIAVFTSYESSDGTNKYCEFGAQNIESVEVELTVPAGEQIGKTNIAPSGTPIADSVSTDYPDNIVANLNDGDKGTRWQSASAGNDGEAAWLGISWDKPYTLKKLVLEWETSHPAENGFYVEVSTDGRHWTKTPFETTRELAPRDADNHQVDTILLTDSPCVSYVRVVCTSAYTSSKGRLKEYPSCWEMEVYGIVAETDRGETGLRGDTDGDGNISATDLTRLARHVGGIEGITDPACLNNADIDLDLAVTSSDLTRLARFVGGIDEEL